MNSSRRMFIESDFVKESLISVYSVDPSEMNQLRGGNIILPGLGNGVASSRSRSSRLRRREHHNSQIDLFAFKIALKHPLIE